MLRPSVSAAGLSSSRIGEPPRGWQACNEIYRVLEEGGEALVVLYHRRTWYWLFKSLSGTEVESEAGDPPVIQVHRLGGVDELFRRFSRVETRLERFPQQTRRRKGLKALLFSWIFVPLTRFAPRPLMRPFGWHIVVKAVK